MGNSDSHSSDVCGLLVSSLDYMGYSKEMIQYRRDTNRKMDEIHNKNGFSVVNITAGGKGEGTALYFESDIDRLYVIKGISCVEHGASSLDSVEFELDQINCSSGYSRLKLVRKLRNSSVSRFLIEESGDTYITNEYSIFDPHRVQIDINGEPIKLEAKTGPAACFGNSTIKYDMVLGFRCVCPTLLNIWISRPRFYDWPAKNVIRKIIDLDGHVVPVANKNSQFPKTEWRICFTKAEVFLMHSLTDLQIKFYIVLKLLAKAVLRPICSAMTSYIMKNVVFWVLERFIYKGFSQSSLISRLIDALQYLKQCIKSNNLESYMIAGRNLLENRVSEQETVALLAKLDELISLKEGMLYQCPKIKTVMQKLKESPESLKKESDIRDLIENLVYKRNIIFKSTNKPDDPTAKYLLDILSRNETYLKYEQELHELLIPDKDKLGDNWKDIYHQRLRDKLS